MPRYVYGNNVQWTEPAPPPAKTDLAVTIANVLSGGNVQVSVPVADPNLNNLPTNIYVVFMTDRHPNFGSLDPNDPASLLQLGLPQASIPYTTSGTFNVQVPGIVAGQTYYVQLVVEFAA